MLWRHIRSFSKTKFRHYNTASSDTEGGGLRFSLALYAFSFVAGGLVAQVLPLSRVLDQVVNQRLPVAGTKEADEYSTIIDSHLKQLPLYQKLSINREWEQVRAWNYVDSNSVVSEKLLATGTLSVPGGFAIKPVFFWNDKAKKSVTILHAGSRLCGYPFLIHGGVLATVLEETLKRTASKDPVGKYTPNEITTEVLELQYRSPTIADNFIVVRANQEENGWVTGAIERVGGGVVVDGKARFKIKSHYTWWK